MTEVVVINTEGKVPAAQLAAVRFEDGCTVSIKGYGVDIIKCFSAIVRGLVSQSKIPPKLLAEAFFGTIEACEEEYDD